VLDGLWARIDELRIHDYELSARAIRALYRKDSHGLIAHFRFEKAEGERGADGNTVFRDERGIPARAKNVHLTGGPLHFGPDSQLQIPATAIGGKPIDGLTVRIRFTPASTKGRLVIFATNNHARHQFSLYHWGNTLWFLAAGNAFRTGPALEAGKAADVLAIYDNHAAFVYVNGKKVLEQQRFSPTGIQADSTFTLGNRLDRKGESFSGAVDLLQIFSYAVPEKDVLALYGKADAPTDGAPDAPEPEETFVREKELP
jgi:hypothetical protein